MLPIAPIASLISNWKVIAIGSLGIIIVLLVLRINYLAERNAQHELNAKAYQTTIKELRDDAKLRDAIALQDRDDSVANEIERSEVLNEIYRHEDSSNCSSVVSDTIDRLLIEDSSGSN